MINPYYEGNNDSENEQRTNSIKKLIDSIINESFCSRTSSLSFLFIQALLSCYLFEFNENKCF